MQVLFGIVFLRPWLYKYKIILFIPYLEAFSYIGGKICGNYIFLKCNHEVTDVYVCGKLIYSLCATGYEKG
jgi:hypothetical protein